MSFDPSRSRSIVIEENIAQSRHRISSNNPKLFTCSSPPLESDRHSTFHKFTPLSTHRHIFVIFLFLSQSHKNFHFTSKSVHSIPSLKIHSIPPHFSQPLLTTIFLRTQSDIPPKTTHKTVQQPSHKYTMTINVPLLHLWAHRIYMRIRFCSWLIWEALYCH